MTNLPLAGRTVALPETRELERFAEMLRAEGAAVRLCPLVAILDAPDPEKVAAWLNRFANGECDDLVAFTGEGLRRLLAAAERLGKREAFLAAIHRVRTIVRGPKPARELVKLGKHPDLAAAAPTTDGLIATLSGLDLNGRRIGVVLYGEEPNKKFTRFLAQAGAEVLPVWPYTYAPASDDAQVLELLAEMAAGRVDAIAFTYAGQIERLVTLAGKHAKADLLRTAFARTTLAAVGPVSAQALRDAGAEPGIELEHPFVMKHLAQALRKLLGPQPGGPA